MKKVSAYQPIGTIHSPFDDIPGMPIQPAFSKARGSIEVSGKYAAGLKDIEGFSHIIILYHFHESGKTKLLAKPFLDDTIRGVFATRSPHRPNHIGLSVVKIKKVEGNKLHFTEVDFLDGTPVLDIKPYVKQFDSRPDAVSGWIEKHYQDGKQPEQTKAK